VSWCGGHGAVAGCGCRRRTCAIMPPKAKKETVEKATDTMSSWKTAEMKKMTESTAKRL